MADKILDRLAKILNQAEHAATEAERDAFMTRAQTMATDNAIDLAVARQHTAKKEQREQPEVRRITIGPRGSKGNIKKVLLISAVMNINDVKCNYFHDNTGIVAFGFPSDIDVAEALYASLVVQMTTAGDAFIKSGEYKKETVSTLVRKRSAEREYDYWSGRYKYAYTEKYVTKPVDGRVARASFYDGFRAEITKRLRDAKKAAVAAYDETRPVTVDLGTPVAPSGFDSTPGAALALVAKEVEVRDFYKEKSTAKGSWRGGSSSGHSSTGHTAGRSAGATARLSSQKALA